MVRKLCAVLWRWVRLTGPDKTEQHEFETCPWDSKRRRCIYARSGVCAAPDVWVMEFCPM